MMETNPHVTEVSQVEQGRQYLDRGDISSALEIYGRVYDPDSLDEKEARNMLIEAHSNLSRKHVIDALENFEEALIMGTDVQRRQALDGIATVAELRSRLSRLTPKLRKALKDILGKRMTSVGLALLSEEDNVVLVSKEAFDKLPGHLAKSGKMSRLPQRLLDQSLPFATQKCVPYADEEDVKFVVELAETLNNLQKMERENPGPPVFDEVQVAQE
jgi:hypothetical protein